MKNTLNTAASKVGNYIKESWNYLTPKEKFCYGLAWLGLATMASGLGIGGYNRLQHPEVAAVHNLRTESRRIERKADPQDLYYDPRYQEIVKKIEEISSQPGFEERESEYELDRARGMVVGLTGSMPVLPYLFLLIRGRREVPPLEEIAKE